MNEVNDILRILNGWWKDHSVSDSLVREHKRHDFDRIVQMINYRPTIILSGLRRVGKTTILYQIIAMLLKNVNPKNIVFFSFDKKASEITEILESYQEITNIEWKKEKIYVFLDELTKLEDWAVKLKLIYDSFPNIKFFVSSSSSLNIEEEAVKNLAGRYFIMNLKPLSFQEFLELKNKKEIVKNPVLFCDEIKKEFKKYLLRGFPEIVEWEDELLIKDYLRTTILDKIVNSDLPSRFKNVNKGFLLDLLKMFYTEPGMYLDYDHLAKDLKVSKKNLLKHIYYLEYSYLIKIVRNFRVSTLSSVRKMQRAYVYWWTLAYCYGENNYKIYENIIASYYDAKNYWRKDNKEIDFVILKDKNIIPIEVKNKDNLNSHDTKNMIYFLKKYNLKEGYIIYNGEEEEEIIDAFKIKKIPFWKALLFPF